MIKVEGRVDNQTVVTVGHRDLGWVDTRFRGYRPHVIAVELEAVCDVDKDMLKEVLWVYSCSRPGCTLCINGKVVKPGDYVV